MNDFDERLMDLYIEAQAMQLTPAQFTTKVKKLMLTKIEEAKTKAAPLTYLSNWVRL
jgi:hypothetical protein